MFSFIGASRQLLGGFGLHSGHSLSCRIFIHNVHNCDTKHNIDNREDHRHLTKVADVHFLRKLLYSALYQSAKMYVTTTKMIRLSSSVWCLLITITKIRASPPMMVLIIVPIVFRCAFNFSISLSLSVRKAPLSCTHQGPAHSGSLVQRFQSHPILLCRCHRSRSGCTGACVANFALEVVVLSTLR
ncbi:MAG: hypothetical protein [Caudoviricetes sp.]|nr:MAG: hypothetical protein [Caudoviricetes sp.]